MADPRLKQIKIKTGVCKRLTKEKGAYEKEVVQMEEKVRKMKADGEDEYKVRKQEECLQESRSMVPDCLRRLSSALDDLQKALETEKDLSEHADFKAAAEVAKEAQKVLDESK